MSCSEEFQGISFFFIIMKHRNWQRCSHDQFRLMLHLLFHLLERSIKLWKYVRWTDKPPYQCRYLDVIKDSIPSPWMEAVFPDHWLGGIPLPKYGQCWGFPWPYKEGWVIMWLLMTIATKQRAGGSVPLVLSCEVTGLININGGHSEGYIRNAGLGSVPKIAKWHLSYLLQIFWSVWTITLIFRLFAS